MIELTMDRSLDATVIFIIVVQLALHWGSSCKAMGDIGCAIVPQGGSGRQFKGDLRLMVFHEPHPRQVARTEIVIQSILNIAIKVSLYVVNISEWILYSTTLHRLSKFIFASDHDTVHMNDSESANEELNT